jgi:hypothetical protein
MIRSLAGVKRDWSMMHLSFSAAHFLLTGESTSAVLADPE